MVFPVILLQITSFPGQKSFNLGEFKKNAGLTYQYAGQDRIGPSNLKKIPAVSLPGWK
jgi:hypothetical protein